MFLNSHTHDLFIDNYYLPIINNYNIINKLFILTINAHNLNGKILVLMPYQTTTEIINDLK